MYNSISYDGCPTLTPRIQGENFSLINYLKKLLIIIDNYLRMKIIRYFYTCAFEFIILYM